MNKISVMTLGFLKDTVKPYMADHDAGKLQERFEKLFRDIKAAGYAAVDLSSFEVRLAGRQFIADLLKTYDLAVASYIHSGRYADPDISVEIHTEDAKTAVDTAVKFGASVFMLVPSVHPNIETLSKESIFANIVANVKPIADYAVAKGLIVVAEDYPDPSLHLSSSEQLDGLLSAVQGLRLVYDSANMLAANEDPIKYAEHFAGRIGHVHLKDVEITAEHVATGERTVNGNKIRTVFIGTGQIEMQSVVQTLIKGGYRGWFTVEFGDMMKVSRRKALCAAKTFVEECMENA